jgi:hypothetical protein
MRVQIVRFVAVDECIGLFSPNVTQVPYGWSNDEAAIWTMPLFTFRLVRWKLLTLQISCYLTQTFWGPIVDHCGRALR